MHEGCSGSFDNGAKAVDKLRMMGFSEGMLPLPHIFECECGNEITMNTFEYKCPHCNMVYGVTPCSAHDPSKVGKAGINY